MPSNRAQSALCPWRRWAIALVALFFFLLAIRWANTPAGDETPTSASLKTFVSAKVVAVLEDDAKPDSWSEGLRLGYQLLRVRLENGEFKGKELLTPNFLSAYYNIDVGEGDRILVRLDLDEDGLPYITAIANYYRTPVLIGLALLFCVLLVLLGGRKGLRALLGLAFTLVSIWSLLIPLLLKGFAPIPLTVAIVALTTAVTLILLTGWSKKTLCATIGCVGGVACAGLLAGVTGMLTPLSGFNMPEAEDLILRATENGLTVRGLLVCGILIASLGAVMDVAMSISSACAELAELNPELDRKQLFRSGMNIGRDAMGTMANTLILAFAGASLNTLILFQVFDYPKIQLLNSDMMAIEVVQGLAGSIGILLTVPLVASLSAWLLPGNCAKKNRNAE